MLEKLPDAVGHALRDRRAGLEKTAAHRLSLRTGTGAITVGSLAFVDHGPIPADYTADGEGRSPPLQWSGVPPTAGSVLLIVEDADAPTPQPLVHAIAVNLPAGDGSLHEGALDRSEPDAMASGVGMESAPGAAEPGQPPSLGRNSLLLAGWLPPDPPPGHGLHRYVFQVFALAPGADLGGTPGRDAVLEAVAEHGIASGWVVGTYERPDGSIKVGSARRAVADEPVADPGLGPQVARL
jgi:hypothetical protein